LAEKQNETTSIQGTIGRITYHNPETHYTVARLDEDGGPGTTVVGTLFPVSEGEEIKVSGVWKRHPRYGLQFQVEHWEKIDPATIEGIEKYLGSGLIKGIGPTYAGRLVAAFGLDTLRILSEEPLRILDVDGIGEVRARRIMQAWQEQRGMQDVMVFLQGHGIGASLALRIFRVYGADTIAQVRENPYALAQQVHGIGFLLADRLAHRIGIRGDVSMRVQAGVLHVLRESADQGHCFLPLTMLKRNAAGLLSIEEDPVEAAVERLAVRGEVALQEADDGSTIRVYPAELFHAERRVAEALRQILATPSSLREEKLLTGWSISGNTSRGVIDLASPELFAPAVIELDADQARAIEQAVREKVLVITGGPGTGKTTLLTSLLQLLRRAKVTVALAAPTGRAAKRMSESAGEEAMTIHRLLEYNPREGGFQRSEEKPLEADFVIVDEASMIDLPLMDHLLRAVDPHSHLILIGDVDQLPSVGPGSVLRDLIESGTIPKIVLKRIFRQERESMIVVNAHRILQGQSLFLEHEKTSDFVFLARESEEEILTGIKTLVREEIPRALDVEAGAVAQTIHVLTPMHRGLLGTININHELQSLLNPVGVALERAGMLLRLGDKVMQLRNNYDKGVFNGDLGRIAAVNKEDGSIKVDFMEKVVEYDSDEVEEVSLAYATSVHKSQGSEYPVVIITLHTSHYMLLHRSILYTAVTRGKKLVVIVGSRKALAMAIRNLRVEKRNTGLREKLLEAAKGTAQLS
jgi:exodeoxyribonuclease V alpha subunit